MPPAQNISQDEWDHHRQEITSLYMGENKTLKNLMTYMNETHGFRPSKYQYETMLKRWNLQKNLSKEEWKAVEHKTKKRKADDKDSDIYLHGFLVPRKKVQTGFAHHITPSLLFTSVPSPQTPPGVIIRTPGTPATRTPGTPRHSGVTGIPASPGIRVLRLDNLPWHQFRRLLEPQVGPDLNRVAQIFNGGDSRVRWGFGDDPIAPGMVPPTGSNSDSSVHEVPIVFDNNSVIPPTSSLLSGLIPSSVKRESTRFIPAVHSRLQAVSLELNEGEHMSCINALLGPGNKDTLSQFLNYAAYLTSNNLLSNDETDNLVRWMIRKDNHSTLRIFFSMERGPTIDAFARRIFESALKFGNVEIVQILLKSGVDPNIPTTGGNTPLQTVVLLDNSQLVRILLDAGANVNAHSTGSVQYTALHSAVTCSCEMVQMLLDNKALINALGRKHFPRTPLQAAAEAGNIEAVTLLVRAGADVNAPAVSSHMVTAGGGATPLQVLVEYFDHDWENSNSRMILECLVAAGADVNALPSWNPEHYDPNTDEFVNHGITALQGATRSGKLELVRFLLSEGADVNAPAATGPYGGKTALQMASSEGCFSIVELLLGSGADVNAPAANNLSTGRTALQAAAEFGEDITIVQLLLECGAEINAPGYPALTLAIRVRLGLDIVPILLDAGANVTAEPSALVAAAEIGDLNIVELLLEKGAGNNAVHVQSAYERAISHRYSDVVDVLSRTGAELSTCLSGEASSPFSSAVAVNNLELITTLVYSGEQINEIYPGTSDPDATWVSNALPIAATMGHNDMVRLLLRLGAAVDGTSINLWRPANTHGGYENRVKDIEDSLGRTALLSAVRFGRDDLVTLLLDAGANVNARPQPFGGWTPLQAAAKDGNTELVQILLKAGAQINASAHTDHGRTALQAAATAGHIDLVRLLLITGADVNAPAAESCGVTALQGAAIQGQLGIALILMQAGADPNAPAAKFYGRTALEGAAEYGRLDMVQLLLNADADIGGRDGKNAERARDLALKNGHSVVAEVLEKCC